MHSKILKIIKYFVIGTLSFTLLLVGLFFASSYIPIVQLYYIKATSSNSFQALASNKFFPYKTNIILGKYELGELDLENGEKIKFWFLSHHESLTGESYTIFELPNGEKKLMHGYFCCEVEVPKDAILSSVSFNEFIKANNGSRP